MTTETVTPMPDILTLTASIVSAHTSHNEVSTDALPDLIQSVFNTMKGLSSIPEEEEEEPVPAVAVNKSVFPDYIVCLEDGKKLKMLKRHLSASYDMSPEEYREKWGLPSDYPMVAPNYSKTRSNLAKENGLGTKRASVEDSNEEPEPEIEVAPKKKTGIKKKINKK